MRKVYCHVCGNEIEDNEKEKYFYDLGEMVAPVCTTCYEYVRIEIEIFKWNLISHLRQQNKVRKQQEAQEEFENDETEKCAHCGKSLAGLLISTEHITRAGKYCSKECYYHAGCKTKKED